MVYEDRRAILAGLGCAALALLLAAPLPVVAQDFPNRFIRIVVPYPPGGQSDIFTRLIAEALKQQLGKPIIVENRPGAATTLGANLVAKSPPDGYTLLLAAASATAIAPVTMNLPNYGPEQITPILLVAKVPYILVASKHRDQPAASERPITMRWMSLGPS